MTFTDLPRIGSDAEAREIHFGTDRFFVLRGGKAHTELSCAHLDDVKLIDNPEWRVATGAQCRELGIPWCGRCG